MKKITMLLLMITVLITSCTKDFEELNTNINEAEPSKADPNPLFGGAISYGLMEAGEMQRVQALYPDLYSQYFATSIGYFATDRYSYNTSWLQFGWDLFFPREINNLVTIINSVKATPEQKAIARIWKVFLFHRYVDLYGDLPYFNAAYPEKPQTFDAQKDIYYDFFNELDQANIILNTSTLTAAYSNQDPIYGAGNGVMLWKKFANTLRLRLALRISKKDASKAKTEGEKAIANGTFISNSDNANALVNDNKPNPLNQISGWNEFRMSAAMESILNGYVDPRVFTLFSPCSDEAVAAIKPFNGIRNGIKAIEMVGANSATSLSNVGERFSVANQTTNPIIVLTYAECCFNKAEAALLGWNVGGGTAEQWYNFGIDASMRQFGVTNATDIAFYQTNTTNIPAIPDGVERAITTLPVKFSNVMMESLEQINTQKWIACFPDGFEGWANFRRTGFPKLFAVPNIESTSTVVLGQFIQRLPYPNAVKSLSGPETIKATARMGGDGQNTLLWFAGGN